MLRHCGRVKEEAAAEIPVRSLNSLFSKEGCRWRSGWRGGCAEKSIHQLSSSCAKNVRRLQKNSLDPIDDDRRESRLFALGRSISQSI